MNVREMIVAKMHVDGFDGLYNANVPCGCLNDDLAPCGGDLSECCPGYRHDFRKGQDCDLSECEGNGMEHWHIESSKP